MPDGYVLFYHPHRLRKILLLPTGLLSTYFTWFGFFLEGNEARYRRPDPLGNLIPLVLLLLLLLLLLFCVVLCLFLFLIHPNKKHNLRASRRFLPE